MKSLERLVLGLGMVGALSVQAAFEADGTVLLTGKVVDIQGRPVAGAVVESYEYGWRQPFGDPEMRQRVSSDADGTFEFRASRARLFLLGRKPGFGIGWKRCRPVPGSVENLTLAPPSVLAGVVVDESDKPLAGAEVFAEAAYSETVQDGNRRSFHALTGNLARDCFHARTDADGRFRIEGFPTNAAAQLAVRAPGKVLKSSDRPQYPGPDTMPFQAGQEDVRLVTEPAGSIEGKIVAEGAGPRLPVARLTLLPDRSVSFAPAGLDPSESSLDGSFAIRDVAAGSYRLQAVFGANAVPDWVAESVRVSVEVGQATRGVQITALRGGILEVAVLGKDDQKPLAEVNVSTSGQGHATAGATGSNGVARFRLPPGDYAVSVFKPNWRQENTRASVEADKTNRVEIELARPPKITGVVRRPDATPAAGLAVRLVGSYGPEEGTAQTDAAGKFELEWDPRRYEQSDRAFCLLIRDPERNLAVAEEVDEGTGPLDLHLAPALTIVGRAECDGRPITNATAALVFWTGNSGVHLPGLCTGTNTPGRFEIPALPPGRKYSLRVSALGYGQKAVSTVDSEEAKRVEIDPVELKPANLQLAGQVVDAADKPVAGAILNLYGESQPAGFARTDRQGRFRFEHVCEGVVRLSASARNMRGSISTEGGDTNVVLRLGESSAVYAGATAHKLQGTVADPAGKPAAGAQVAVFPSGASHWIKTGTNGAFSLTWRLKSWQVEEGGSAVLVVRDLARNLAAAEDISEETTNLNVRLQPALTLTGRVEGPDGKPLAGAEVGVWLLAARTYSQVEEKLITTEANGRFDIKTLPPSQQYTVFAKAQGHGRSQQEVEPDTETNRIELEPFVLKVADQVVAGQVVDAKDKPVSGASVHLYGEDQPEGNVTTDRQGRFSFKVCEGPLRLSASGQSGYGNAAVEAGDTNVLIQVGRDEPSARTAVRRSPLKGKPLPDLAALGLAADAAPAGKPVLLCLVDIEQRPSRRLARLLAEQHAALRQKGLTVLAAQAVVTSAQALKEWQEASPVPFPVGRATEKLEKAAWVTGVESLPWLILTDAGGRVVAEGFPLEELEAKLKETSK